LKESPNAFAQSKTVLLLLERREDPVTPLLSQWTYQVFIIGNNYFLRVEY